MGLSLFILFYISFMALGAEPLSLFIIFTVLLVSLDRPAVCDSWFYKNNPHSPFHAAFKCFIDDLMAFNNPNPPVPSKNMQAFCPCRHQLSRCSDRAWDFVSDITALVSGMDLLKLMSELSVISL